MLAQCHSLLDCSSFLLVCFFYGYSLVYLNQRYRFWCATGLFLLIIMLYLMKVGPFPLWSGLSMLLGFALTWRFTPITGFILPIRITPYMFVNIMLFFIPFIPVIVAAGQSSDNNAAAMLLFTAVLIPVPWTLFMLIEKLVHSSPAMLGSIPKREHEERHLYDRRFLRITWTLSSLSLLIGAIIVLMRWAIL